jgi:hypothetical protein
MTQTALCFEGTSLTAPDRARLGDQQRKVEAFMLGLGGAWVTLDELARATGAPPASASARLRTMRARGFHVERKRAGFQRGLWLYRVLVAMGGAA